MFFDELEEEMRWEEAQDALRDFQSYLAVRVPVLRIERDTDVLGWQKLQGVYLNYDEQGRLLYLGFTLDCFQNRKSQHEKRFETYWLDLIVLPEGLIFLAPALESFLLKRLFPELNRGKKHV